MQSRLERALTNMLLKSNAEKVVDFVHPKYRVGCDWRLGCGEVLVDQLIVSKPDVD
jgi:hypothetical protein